MHYSDVKHKCDRECQCTLAIYDKLRQYINDGFITADHALLIGQTRSINIEGNALTWLESHISNRTQALCIGHNSRRTLLDISHKDQIMLYVDLQGLLRE